MKTVFHRKVCKQKVKICETKFRLFEHPILDRKTDSLQFLTKDIQCPMYVSRNDLHLHRKSSTISWCGPEVLLCSLLDPHQMALATTSFFTVLEQEISDTRSKDIQGYPHQMALATTCFLVVLVQCDEDINCKSLSTNVVYLPLVELTRRFLVAPRRTS